MLQSRYNTLYMKNILSFIDKPKIAIEYGVYKGGTFELLGEYADIVYGIDSYFFVKEDIESFVSQWVHPRMKSGWELEICDVRQSKKVNSLENESVDIVHYDAGRDRKTTQSTVDIFFDKLTDRSIVSFDNLQLTPLDNMFSMLSGYNKLFPFGLTVDKERRGKVYCAKTEEFAQEYRARMEEWKTETFNGIQCVYQKEGMSYVKNDPRY